MAGVTGKFLNPKQGANTNLFEEAFPDCAVEREKTSVLLQIVARSLAT
jgi:hypothetical protein